MERTTLWSRVGDWIKHPRKSLGWDVTEISESDIAPPYSHSDADTHASRENGNKRHWLTFGGNRKLIEEQTRQVSELVQALHSQSQRQTEVAETANANLERLISSLAALPAVLQSQQQALGEIQRQMGSQMGGQKQIQEALGQLGGIKDAVKESAAAFARYTEVVQQSNDNLSEEMKKQSQAVARMAESSDPMMRAINDIRVEVDSRGEELARCVTTMNTKLIQFSSAALALAVIAAIIGLVAFMR